MYMWPAFPDLSPSPKKSAGPENPDLDGKQGSPRPAFPDLVHGKSGPLFLRLPAHKFLRRQFVVVLQPGQTPFRCAPAFWIFHVKATCLSAGDEAFGDELIEILPDRILVAHVERLASFSPSQPDRAIVPPIESSDEFAKEGARARFQ